MPVPSRYDRLRSGVEDALLTFGSGFLAHPANEALRRRIASGGLAAPAYYYHQLLRLAYRLWFGGWREAHHLAAPEALARPRDVDGAGAPGDGMWRDLLRTSRLHPDGALGAIPDLEGAALFDADLQRALRGLDAIEPADLGPVYEGLLEHHPIFVSRDGCPAFEFVPGKDRKTTGSYYTRPELVHELIVSALEPVIADRLQGADTPQAQADALLAIRVCDPAAGSGQFLLAAARRLGLELARVRTGAADPDPDALRAAVGDAIAHCLYGVDKNPLAVDLCKGVLWLEAGRKGLPLTFLDHRIRCGDSLVGVLDLEQLPTYCPCGRRGPQRRGCVEFSGLRMSEKIGWKSHDLRTACNVWTAAFFVPPRASPESVGGQPHRVAPASEVSSGLAGDGQPHRVAPTVEASADALAARMGFFHWPLEFPDVFPADRATTQGRPYDDPDDAPAVGASRCGCPPPPDPGFDVILSNPPWERIKLQEQEFFAARDPAIARAPNKAARARFIAALPQTNPALRQSYERAWSDAMGLSRFLRASGRYPLTSQGDVNTYSVFAELFAALLSPRGRAGVLVPTGIATDHTNRRFFAALGDAGRLASLYDLENREKWFASVDSRYRFSLLTLRGAGDPNRTPPEFVFFATRPAHLHDRRDAPRRFTLAREDFARLNPNTRTCPNFRTRRDADLARRIYERVPILVNDETGENPWGLRFSAMFHMSNHSGLFRTRGELERIGGLLTGNRFECGGETWLPLYEAKMTWYFDHRFGTCASHAAAAHTGTHWPSPTPAQYADPSFAVLPRYWVPEAEVRVRLGEWDREWLLAYRALTNPTNERTFIAGLAPICGCGNSLILCTAAADAASIACLVANFASLVLDWVARQKVGGTNMNIFYVKQFPILPPAAYTPADVAFIVPRVLELTCTTWDLQPFAADVRRDLCGQGGEVAPGCGGDLCPWDAERRAVLRAELDARYARLYGLTEEDLQYVLDPADVCGPDFPGETFRVLKQKELRRFGEYRTRRLVLEAWNPT